MEIYSPKTNVDEFSEKDHPPENQILYYLFVRPKMLFRRVHGFYEVEFAGVSFPLVGFFADNSKIVAETANFRTGDN